MVSAATVSAAPWLVVVVTIVAAFLVVPMSKLLLARVARDLLLQVLQQTMLGFYLKILYAACASRLTGILYCIPVDTCAHAPHARLKYCAVYFDAQFAVPQSTTL